MVDGACVIQNVGGDGAGNSVDGEKKDQGSVDMIVIPGDLSIRESLVGTKTQREHLKRFRTNVISRIFRPFLMNISIYIMITNHH